MFEPGGEGVGDRPDLGLREDDPGPGAGDDPELAVCLGDQDVQPVDPGLVRAGRGAFLDVLPVECVDGLDGDLPAGLIAQALQGLLGLSNRAGREQRHLIEDARRPDLGQARKRPGQDKQSQRGRLEPIHRRGSALRAIDQVQTVRQQPLDPVRAILFQEKSTPSLVIFARPDLVREGGVGRNRAAIAHHPHGRSSVAGRDGVR